MTGKSESKLLLFVRGVGAITLANVLTKAATFFLLPLYTAHIRPDQMGIYETIIGLVGFVFPLMVLSLDSSFSAFYFDKETDEYRSSVLSTTAGALFLSSTFLLVLIPFAPLISQTVFGTKVYTLPIMIALSGAALNMWHLPFALSLRMNNRLTVYAVVSFVGSLVSIGTNVYLILFLRMGINALIISGTLMHLVLFVLYYYLSGASFRRKYFDFSLLKRMLAYSLPLLPLVLINWILAASDRLILLKYAGSSETGIYGIADKFPAVLSLLTNGIMISYAAFAFSSVKEKNSKSQFVTIQAFTHLALVSLSVVVASVAREIVGFMTDSAYLAAYRLLGPLLLGQVCYMSSVLISYAFAFVKKSYLNLIPAAIGASVNLVLNFIFIPLFGSYAAAITTMVGYFCILLVTYLLARGQFDCNYLIGRTIITLGLATVAIFFMAEQPLLLRLLCAVVVLFLICAVYFKPITDMIKKAKTNETAIP